MTIKRTNKNGEVIDISEINGNSKIKFTDIGGLAVLLTNRTGVDTIKGTIVAISDNIANPNSFIVCPGTASTRSFVPCGIVLEDGIAEGSDAWIVISGRAEVLLKDATASTVGYWSTVSSVAGRAEALLDQAPTGTTYAADSPHMRQIGSALETKGAGVDVLCKMILQFN